jgi:cell fate regulator YaaT (PSP1 superfamily)
VSHVVTVRYGFMRHLGEFTTDSPEWERGDWAVVSTARGTEIGDVLLAARDRTTDDTGEELGAVVRRADKGDLERMKQLKDRDAVETYQMARKVIATMGLDMKLTSVEPIFGGEKLIFYFTAEGRVDFRSLVRELARTLRTRIEMRQIGARDEARLLGDVGHCGLTLCCQTFLRELEPVTMRMARSQKATLDPSKISGACGRLMCCLRYEDETYRELKSELPPLGSVYDLPGVGPSEVIGHQILARRVRLVSEQGRRSTLRAEELTAAAFVEKREPVKRQSRRSGRQDKGRRSGRVRRQNGDTPQAEAPEPQNETDAGETSGRETGGSPSDDASE